MSIYHMGEAKRIRITIQGIVQGVGFRPFIYRLATGLQLSGWIKNTSQGVLMELEGPSGSLQAFFLGLKKQKPALSLIEQMNCQKLEPIGKSIGQSVFEILPSDKIGQKQAPILPDLATCTNCLRELLDPNDRRYRYPFINCTQCGPRYSIITDLPYDRPNTTMAGFLMCKDCLSEYKDPLNRRFHAQPNACPVCGPELQLWKPDGTILATRDEALMIVVEAIKSGKIIAIKGLGGYLLCADATSELAVSQLRTRKNRKTKPFALMYPDIDQVLEDCQGSQPEIDLLTAPQSPIVLLRKQPNAQRIAPTVAPGNLYLGVMLPYTPLFHLLLSALDSPIIATSGNQTNEPICANEQEVLQRLGTIADLLLVHNRAIANRIDDSIVQIIQGKPMVLRRARSYASMPVPLQISTETMLAVGGHLKNTVALALEKQIFTSPHIGDLIHPDTDEAHRQAIQSLCTLYEVDVRQVACDGHDDYRSTHSAIKTGKPMIRIQHHYAHVLSCMAEHGIDGPCLGVSWDGTGLGDDGTLWGGEFLLISETGYHRLAHFLPFPLPGGEQAAREPHRSALGALYALMGDSLFESDKMQPFLSAFSAVEQKVLRSALSKNLNCPITSSAGRLFDAIASLMALCHENTFEGEAAMSLEFAAEAECALVMPYPFQIQANNSAEQSYCIDWRPMLEQIIDDCWQRAPASNIAARFHYTLVEVILAVARLCPQSQVILTGGCFQNRYLLEKTILSLKQEGLSAFWHGTVPPNDGGLAIGQIMGGIRANRICARENVACV